MKKIFILLFSQVFASVQVEMTTPELIQMYFPSEILILVMDTFCTY